MYANVESTTDPFIFQGFSRINPFHKSWSIMDQQSIFPLGTLLVVALTVDHLKHTARITQGFDQSKSETTRQNCHQVFSEIEDFDNFLMINVDTSYNVLLSRP